VLAEAQALADQDVEINLAMGRHGSQVVPHGANILHHCNTGALATVDVGTALGVVYECHRAGKGVHVWVDETRPRLQGARLTAWELMQDGIPATLIADSAAAHLMKTGAVQWVVVGADRICANGDTANKIGTCQLAIAAHHYGVRVMVVAPSSTVDMATASGAGEPSAQATPSAAQSASAPATACATATAQASSEATATASGSGSATSTVTATPTPSLSPGASSSNTPSTSLSGTPTPSISHSASTAARASGLVHSATSVPRLPQRRRDCASATAPGA
jgi:S-methyl-5-thioribose-1-phosphate isomerase